MLVVLGVLSVLALMLLPVLGKVRANSLSAKCVSNLKAVGTVILAYAVDHNGRSVTALYTPDSAANPNPDPNYSGQTINRVWSQSLQAGGYLGKNPDELVCPAYPPFRYRGTRMDGSKDQAPAMHTYGLRQFSYAFSTGVRQSDPAINLQRVDRPATYALLMDSYSRGESAQIYHVTWPNSASAWGSNVKIHLRHNNRANLFFADGSVRSLSLDDLVALNDGLSAASVFTLQQVPLP